jgi:hypothetical protein
MITLTIGVLLCLSGYLGMRLFSVVSENAALRTHVATLKRQIARLR